MTKCIRCGKERIIKSSVTETLETSSIVYTETICPDPECQIMVDKGLVVEEHKRKFIRAEQARRVASALRKKRA